MQKVIMIPVEQYDRMLQSYDKAMEELQRLRDQIKEMSCNKK